MGAPQVVGRAGKLDPVGRDQIAGIDEGLDDLGLDRAEGRLQGNGFRRDDLDGNGPVALDVVAVQRSNFGLSARIRNSSDWPKKARKRIDMAGVIDRFA